jgi:polyisoprenoid-binding protein YceI
MNSNAIQDSSATATTLTNQLPTKDTKSDTESTWEVDAAHSAAHFKVRHLMVSHVRGTLGPVSGKVIVNEKDITRSSIDIRIDASGVDTREPKRDEHLRSADFLDVANHRYVTFVSRNIKKESDGTLKVTGDLTIRGTSKPVTLEVEPLTDAQVDPWGNTKRGASARARLNRKDWALQWNVALETGGVVVGEQVDIEIEVELAKAK